MRILACLLVVGTCHAGATAPVPPAPEGGAPTATEPAAVTESAAVLQRIAVVGASASAGFNLKAEAGVDVPLAAVLDRMVLASHEPVLDCSDPWFFYEPREKGRAAVEKALEHRPTLVVAVDFLFWFSYGFAPREEARLPFLEGGLAFLSRFDCPLLIAEIPDMREAVQTGQLAAGQVPSPESLARLNERVRAWAQEHENVILVPLADFLGRVRAGEPVRVAEVGWKGEALEHIIQSDRLHPTMNGLTALGFLCLETLREQRPELSPAFYRRDPDALAVDTLIELEDDPAALDRPRDGRAGEPPAGSAEKPVEKAPAGS